MNFRYVIAAAALIAIPAAAWSQDGLPAFPPARVQVAVAEVRNMAPTVEVSGTVVSLNDSRIAAEVEGVLTANVALNPASLKIAPGSEERVTIVWLLVPWALDVLFAIESGELKLKDFNLDQWRLMHIGAQPVPPSLVREWQKCFPHHQYDTNYGLTESTGPGCVHLGMENSHKVGAIGRPGFDWEYRIVDETLSPVAPGTPGELIIKGPGVMREY